MVRTYSSGGGYISRNRTHQRKVDDRLRLSIDDTDDLSNLPVNQDAHRATQRNRREREKIIFEYEEELRKQQFAEDEIIKLLNEFRKGLRSKGGMLMRSEGASRYGYRKDRKRVQRQRLRLRNSESSKRFAEAFQVECTPGMNRNVKHRNPVDDVFDAQHHEHKRKLVREKRLQSIWKNKVLMDRLRKDVFAEEYRKIFGRDPE
mmetsp:Transcript_6058/g.9190  ORF Transcript_6058/g.9190 Transcript_6058/m.9190 type:complete len:204 (-) Transcript_6058:12-623(-)